MTSLKKKLFYFSVVLFLFFLLILLYFSPSLISGNYLLSLDIFSEYDSIFKIENFKAHNNLLTDTVLQFLPYRAINQYYEGISFWNPYSLGGLPFFEDIQSRTFELTNLFANIFNIPLNYFFLFSAFLLLNFAGVSMYYFLKELKINSVASLSGAIVFIFSSPIIIWINYTLGATFVWLPFLFLCIEKIFNEKKVFFAFLSLAVSFQLFAGHPQAALINLIFISLYIIYKFVVLGKLDFKKMLLIVVFLILGIGLSSIQTIPAFNFIKQSEVYQTGRSHNSFSFLEEFKLQIFNIGDNFEVFKDRLKNRTLLLLQPNYFGNPVERNYKYPENALLNNYYETTSYTGIFSIILLVISAILFIKRKKVYFWFFCLVFSFVLSINLPFFSLLAYLPIINKINLGRLIFVFIFCLSVLVAFAVNILTKKIEQKINNKSLYVITTLIPLIIFVDLFVHFSFLQNNKNNISINDYKNNEIVNFLKDKEYRYIGISDLEGGIHVPLIPNQSMIFEIYDARGYFVMRPNRFFELSKKYLSRRGNYILADDIYSKNFLNIYSVKYILCDKNLCEKYKDAYNLIKEAGNIKVLENDDALPRAFIAYNYRPYSNIDEVHYALQNKNIKIEENILVEGDYSNNSSIVGITSVKIRNIDTDKIEITANAEEDGLLVLTDNYYDGWNVYVNNNKKDIIPVMGSLKGVFIKKGENHVEFFYKPKYFNFSIIVSCFSLLILIILYFYILNINIARGVIYFKKINKWNK